MRNACDKISAMGLFSPHWLYRRACKAEYRQVKRLVFSAFNAELSISSAGWPKSALEGEKNNERNDLTINGMIWQSKEWFNMKVGWDKGEEEQWEMHSLETPCMKLAFGDCRLILNNDLVDLPKLNGIWIVQKMFLECFHVIYALWHLIHHILKRFWIKET